MNDADYLAHCRRELESFARQFLERTRDLGPQDGLRELALAFGELAAGQGDLYTQGQALTSRLFTTYPDFAPLFPRALLWFFGGECLHFMAEEEIVAYQQHQPDSG